MAKDGQTTIDFAHTRRTHPATSHHAADSVTPHLTRVRFCVRRLLEHFGPSTAERVCRLYRENYETSASDSTPRGRLSELRALGLVKVLPERMRNSRGRWVQVWATVE